MADESVKSESELRGAEGMKKKQELHARFVALKGKRQSGYDQEWREIQENILPRRGRFFTSESGNNTAGKERKRNIINSRPTIAARTLRALMTSGMASAARRWFLGRVADLTFKEVASVMEWSYQVETVIRDVLKKSNIYQALDNVIGDLGSFGTSVLYVEEDLESEIRAYVFPIGSYCLANSPRLTPDTCFREVVMTTRQLVKDFGEENCSDKVKDDFKNRRLDVEHEVLHVIMPNDDYQPGKLGRAGMAFSACWFEVGSVGDKAGKFLRESGYHEDPLMKVRWNVTGEDVYGSDCPGMEALPDAKALQHTAKREEQAFEKVVNPPMAGPTSLIGQRASLLAGDLTYVDTMSGGQKFEPAMKVEPGTLERFAMRQARLEAQIDSAYYADLALMFQRLNQGTMTATEINARQQEQMLLLGSVAERSEEELLRPLLDRVFMILWRNGKIPPPPEEIVNTEFKYDFVSVIAQAQKLLGLANLERFAAMIGNLVAVAPDVIDKLDTDQLVDEVADILAVQPGVVRSDDEVAELRAKRAEAQAQQAAVQDQAAAVEGAKVLSQADTSGDNALTRLMGNVTGTPRPGTPRA
jgi:hypothetical protein